MSDLKKLFDKYNIPISEKEEDQFSTYFSDLVETNKVLNLTAITERQDVFVKHFLDSVLPFDKLPKNASVVDVGTGAGFPALPLKIVRPDLDVYLVDSLNKRINFLKNLTQKLGLKKVSCIHSRAEDFAKEKREFFDVAVARAVASLDTLTEYLLPLVKVGGLVIVYKSSKLEEELQNATKAINILGGDVQEILTFKIEGELERNILILKKIKQTPKQYPRDKNKPKTNPIS